MTRVDKMAFNKDNLDPYDIVLNTKELSDEKVTQFYFISLGFFFLWFP